MHHRPHHPTVRSSSSLSVSPRMTPLLPSSAMTNYPRAGPTPDEFPAPTEQPRVCGLPLKYVSPTPPALAVLLNELLKGIISFIIALFRRPEVADRHWRRMPVRTVLRELPWPWTAPFWYLWGEILGPDCWKLSIPAILYVVQNSLQFVAVSNLPVASFQVTYQMKILTTAAFSVALLGMKLTPTKWLSLFVLAIGVGIVQIQTATVGHAPGKSVAVGSAHDSAPLHIHVMSPLKGFGAVTAACFTSGLAGVYFEMVLKNSRADLWVRNVQLSLFSLIPALIPLLYSSSAPPHAFVSDIFRNFGGWAWATVAIQVLGGLVTAVVISTSSNIIKGFATSLSIILSFLASVALFHFRITPSFIIGSTAVLVATWMYNQPPGKEPPLLAGMARAASGSGKAAPFPGSPIDEKQVILGHFPSKRDSKPRLFGISNSSTTDLRSGTASPWGSAENLLRTNSSASALTSPFPSRPVSPLPPTTLAPPKRFSVAPSPSRSSRDSDSSST
ncbi:UDP-galactose transporter [Mycena kentingensis (nom. inval.)]|nr:UDP-galactose transporter [Mycena kentingensis (nom. inval.)]